VANDTTASDNNTSGSDATSSPQQQQGGEHRSSSEQQQLVEQKWTQIRSALKARWSQLTDEDLRMIDGDSRKLVALVHQKTNLPLHEIEEGIDQIAAESEGLISRIARTASEFAQSAGSFAQSAGSQVSQPVQRAYTQARELVEARPLPSVASAFAAGMLLGILTYALSAEER
jgi:ElaB/YqjD/DUF883 family membrane-anchored ribosome-binding protein